MSRNLESTSQLTEFAPLSPEDKSSFGLLGFSKFFKLGKGDNSEPDNGSDKVTSSVEGEWQQPIEDADQSEASGLQYSVDVSEGRSLPNVLKRISNLVALKNVGLTSYKDTDLKQYWMPDSFSKECYDCGEKFTTFRRRHHCRVCGQIFCSRCCNQEIPGKIMNCTGDLRVCTYCCKVVLSYLQSADIGADLSADLRALQEDLQTKFGNPILKNTDTFQTGISSTSITEREESSTSVRRKPSVGYQEERFALGRAQSPSYLSEEERCRALQNSSSLRSLYEEVIRQPSGITLQSHRYRLRTYPNCFFGSELVDWLIAQNKAGTRIQGIAIGQALLEAGYLEPIGELDFMDGLSLYRPVPLKPVLTPQAICTNEGQEPLWVKQISQQDSVNTTDSESENRLSEIEEEAIPISVSKSSSNYYLDINFKDNVVHVSRPSPPPQEEIRAVEKMDSSVSSIVQKRPDDVVLNTDWDKTSYVRSNEGEDSFYQNLNSAFHHHRQNLLRQMLNTEGISQSWSDVILPVVDNIVQLVRPDMKNDIDEMDVRHYVQIKKLPGGQRSESTILSGVVCSKNVAHRLMRTRISNPRILLLRCSVVYQRIEGRLLSLEPVMMQEHEYLRQIVARIAALQPDIVLVYRNVSRLAQEYLLKLGITLILNTKLSVLDRVARFTQADIVTSVDANISKPQLGSCQSFYLKTFQTEHGASKTLMFFEGCANPELSCTLLLRGGSHSELTKLKKIVSFIIFASYNWKLERCFLMDEFAKSPGPPPELFRESPDPDFKSANTATESKSEIKIRPEKEDKRILVQSVQDCSDPLQSYLNSSDDAAPKQMETSPIEEFSVAELPFSNKFRKSLDDTILSISLYIKFSVPYLETEAGRNCVLRKFFPNEIFYSKQFSNNSETNRAANISEQMALNSLESQLKGVRLLPKHQFVTAKITDNVNSIEVQTLLALYRANGGRIPLRMTENEEREIHENIKNEIKNLNPVKKLDVLDPVNHQRLPVLFCSYSYSSQNSPAFCVDPWIVNMYFYGHYDIPLGSFLERYCFRSSYVCPSVNCDTPMLEHVRRFVHDPGAVHLTLSQLDQLDSKEIVMWSWCTKCKAPTPMVPMSSDTWSFSFAKYLELRFRGHIYTRRDMETCKHSLHHDHYQYFGMKKIVASFKFSTIRIWEIFLPPPVIGMQIDSCHQNVIMDELRSLAIKGHDVYSSVLERLVTLEGSEEDIQSMKHQQQKEQAVFKAKIEEIQVKLTSPILESKKLEGIKSDKEVEILLWRIEDSVVHLKRMISEAVIGWNARFQEAVNVVKKKDDKEKEKQKRSSEGTVKPLPQVVPLSEGQENDEEEDEQSNDVAFDAASTDSLRRFSDNVPDSADNDSEDSLSFRGAESGDHDEKSSDDAKDRRSYSEVISNNCDDSQIDIKHDKKTVKNILSQILTSNKDFAPVSSPWSLQEHYLLPPGPTAYIMVHENEPSSIISYALASHDYQRYLEENQHKKNLTVSLEVPVASPINRRKTISSSSNTEKESESADTRKSTVLSFLRGANISSSSNRLSVEANASPNASIMSETGSTILTDQDENKEEGSKKINKTSSSCHMEIIFADSTTNFYCRIYCAEQFAALRQTVFPMGEEAFVRSLSRCVQWAARGGKSGSTFCKTNDDRFILKEMSKLELQLFLDFASHYFSYIQKCRENNQPTLLGKIVGVYTVSFRNTNSNSALKSNLLVMENLFYRRNVTQKYDLKGSVRNRLVNPSVHYEGEIVYLDENLLKMTTDSPLYILPHSQAVLMKAIESDTQFLASQTVMDYSLLVGLDEDRRELVIGIIDYIRTFTWDKKLETMVKKSVIMGGQGKQPTIIQPKDYRDRFIAAMHRYFLPVPDRWSGLGRTTTDS